MTDQQPGGVRPLDLVATAILVIGGVLAIACTFAPVKQVTFGGFGLRGQAVVLTIGVWGSRYTGPVFGAPDEALRLGIPLVVGAILLIVLSLLALPTGNTRRLVVLRPLWIGAAGIVIGTIWTAALYFANVFASLPRGITTPTDEAGWPLLLAAGAATALGLVVALVSFWRGTGDGPPRPSRPAGDVIAYAIEPETPPYGVPAQPPETER